MTLLHFDDRGTGEPVLLLHGMALDLRMWDDQVAPLSAAGYRVVRVDLLGFGRSPPVTGPYSHGETLKAVLDHLGIARAHVIGLSMGGRIAAEFVQWHPQAAKSLVLVDADITGVPFPTLGPAIGAIFAAGKAGDIALAKRLFADSVIFDAVRRRPAVMARVQRMVDEYSGWLFVNPGSGLERRPAQKTSEALSCFALPTLALVGELDAADIHGVADTVVARMPGARKRVLRDVGHMPNMEDPAAFNRALIEFLAGAA